MSLARERFTRRTELMWTDENDLWQLQRVLKFQQRLFGPPRRVFDALLALLVSQLPQQEERHEFHAGLRQACFSPRRTPC